MIITNYVYVFQVEAPILGIVHNMSYFMCCTCNTKHYVFGRSLADKLRGSARVPVLGEVPIKADISLSCDGGVPSVIKDSVLSEIFDGIVDNILPALSFDEAVS